MRRGFPYRRVVDDRLLFGALDDRVPEPLPTCAPSDHALARLTALLRDTLPWLGKPEVELAWGGPIHARALHELPLVSASQSSNAITLVSGMSGSGLAWGLMVGALVRGLVRGDLDTSEDRRLREALASTRVPWLSGAMTATRWLGTAVWPDASESRA